jgi:hypothetical protein
MSFFYCPYYGQPRHIARAVTFEEVAAVLGQPVIVKLKDRDPFQGTITYVDYTTGNVAVFRPMEMGSITYFSNVSDIEYITRVLTGGVGAGGGFGGTGGGFGGAGGFGSGGGFGF